MSDNTQPDAFDLLPSTNEEIGTSQVNDAVFQALKLQMPGLVDTDEWSKLPNDLRYKLLETHAKSKKEVSVAKPLQPEDPPTSRNTIVNSGEVSQQDMLYVQTHAARSYANIGAAFHLNNKRSRGVRLWNTSNQRIAFQIMPTQLDPYQHSNNWSGFILPNSKVISKIWFNKRNYNKFIITYEPSTHYDIATCFKSGKTLPEIVMVL